MNDWSDFARVLEWVLVGTAVAQSGLLCYHAVAKRSATAWVVYGIAVLPSLVCIRMFGSGWSGFMWRCLGPGMEQLQADPWLRAPALLIPLSLALFIVAPVVRLLRRRSVVEDA